MEVYIKHILTYDHLTNQVFAQDKWKHVYTKTYILRLTAVLFIISQNWKQCNIHQQINEECGTDIQWNNYAPIDITYWYMQQRRWTSKTLHWTKADRHKKYILHYTTIFYSLSICVPPKFMLKLNLQCNSIKRWGLWRWLSHESSSLLNELKPFMSGAAHSICSHFFFFFFFCLSAPSTMWGQCSKHHLQRRNWALRHQTC